MLSETVKSWPAQWMAKGREEGREEALVQAALKMLAKGIDLELITSVTGVSREQLAELTRDKNRVSEPAADYKTARKPRTAKRCRD